MAEDLERNRGDRLVSIKDAVRYVASDHASFFGRHLVAVTVHAAIYAAAPLAVLSFPYDPRDFIFESIGAAMPRFLFAWTLVPSFVLATIVPVFLLTNWAVRFFAAMWAMWITERFLDRRVFSASVRSISSAGRAALMLAGTISRGFSVAGLAYYTAHRRETLRVGASVLMFAVAWLELLSFVYFMTGGKRRRIVALLGILLCFSGSAFLAYRLVRASEEGPSLYAREIQAKLYNAERFLIKHVFEWTFWSCSQIEAALRGPDGALGFDVPVCSCLYDPGAPHSCLWVYNATLGGPGEPFAVPARPTVLH